ncbi:hypothetical protein NF27_KF00020 [Candidatus Jidaibacter acanthamoeba]|uniref:Uncharacterized protein n=1 Tax=Candidatus Jidaibacter acanthamoebae TaxID=86105 RepID=A0A0C1QEU1_9RICK|nr:hypothetical protein NF27_KF00020 [Candidatus Jidaibacter acanthamoeba]
MNIYDEVNQLKKEIVKLIQEIAQLKKVLLLKSELNNTFFLLIRGK